MKTQTMNEWKLATPPEAMTALYAGTHDVERRISPSNDAFWRAIKADERYWSPDQNHRIRPIKQYREINARVPVGMTVKPKFGQKYLSIDLSLKEAIYERRWDNDKLDELAFDRGLCFDNEADATECARALGFLK
jgi:hypothetical protein